jgi:hypothetical protein
VWLCVVYNARLYLTYLYIYILALCYVMRGARGGRCSISSSSSSRRVVYSMYIQDERDDKVHWSFTLCVVSNAKCFSSSHIVQVDIDFCIVFQWFFCCCLINDSKVISHALCSRSAAYTKIKEMVFFTTECFKNKSKTHCTAVQCSYDDENSIVLI